MNRLFVVLMAILFSLSMSLMSFAQQGPAPVKSEKTTVTEKTTVKKTVKRGPVKHRHHRHHHHHHFLKSSPK